MVLCQPPPCAPRAEGPGAGPAFSIGFPEHRFWNSLLFSSSSTKRTEPQRTVGAASSPPHQDAGPGTRIAAPAPKVTHGAEPRVVLQGQVCSAHKPSVSSAAPRADMQVLNAGTTSCMFKQKNQRFAYSCTYKNSVIWGFTSPAVVKIHTGMQVRKNIIIMLSSRRCFSFPKQEGADNLVSFLQQF